MADATGMTGDKRAAQCNASLEHVARPFQTQEGVNYVC